MLRAALGARKRRPADQLRVRDAGRGHRRARGVGCDHAADAGDRVSLKAGPLCCSTRVSIVAPDGSPVVAPTLMSTSGAFVDATKLPKAGTYTIVIDPQGAATGNSTVRLFDVHRTRRLRSCSVGPRCRSPPRPPGQNARLTFTGVAGRRASLNLAPTCCATAISVLAPDGAEVADDSSITTTGLFLEPWTLPQSGTYTSRSIRRRRPGQHDVHAYDVPPDLAAATSIGGAAVTLALATPGQNATVSFDGSAAGGHGPGERRDDHPVEAPVTNPDGSNLSPQSSTRAGRR